MSIICSDCGHHNPADAEFCAECGAYFDAEIAIGNEFSIIEDDLDIEIATQEFSNKMSDAIDELDETMQHQARNSSRSKSFVSSASTDLSTRLEVIAAKPSSSAPVGQAILVCQETDERFKLPTNVSKINIGRKHDQVPIHVDLTNITHADLISRFHAAIELENGLYYLEDMDSANGTWLNSQSIKPGTRFRQQLRHGDTIAFGRSQTVKLTFHEQLD